MSGRVVSCSFTWGRDGQQADRLAPGRTAGRERTFAENPQSPPAQASQGPVSPNHLLSVRCTGPFSPLPRREEQVKRTATSPLLPLASHPLT